MKLKKIMAIGIATAMMTAMPAVQIFAEVPNMGGNQNVTYASSPSEIVTSTVVNTASDLEADMTNATTIEMNEENSQVTIDAAGTYIVTGSCSDGNITVKKNTTGVVLVLKDLDLTSTTGATVSLNKYSEVKVIIEGNVRLTDSEDPADEDSTDTEVADAFDGAALKAKDGSNVYLTGDGTLTLDGSSCKNGLKVGDADEPSFVIDGDLTINITAANDGINAGYDMTILSGTVNISAEDDAIHADHILTIGSEDGSGPSVNVKNSNEGLEGTVVNLFGGNGTVNSSDDAINAANKDALYEGVLTYSINITGGTWTVKCTGDGLDSNGNINITGGKVNISSGTTGGEAGMDYDGSLYVAEETLNNGSGVSGPDNMMGGQMPDQQSGQMPDQQSGQMPDQQSSQMPDQSQTEEPQNEESSQPEQPQAKEPIEPSSGNSGNDGAVTNMFPDVADSSQPYFTPVYWAVENGIVKGYSDGTFGPTDSCTRAQFVVMIWRLAGKPSATSAVDFSDISSDLSYYNAIQWAVEQGIIKGFDDGTFRPDDTVTREQIAIMLWRMADRPSATVKTTFSDVSESDSSYKAIQWGSEEGLLKGFSGGAFAGSQNCLRQQIVIILYRYARNVLGQDVSI